MDYPILDEDGWAEAEYSEAYDYVMGETQSAGLTAAQSEAVWEQVMDGPEPYYTDNSGTIVHGVDDAIADVTGEDNTTSGRVER